MTSNRHNLTRYIPEKVKRYVRQRDGFGCIVCGNAIYQYDHLGTEFKDSERHDPNKIVLLCGGCHDQKTRGFLSTDTILMRAKSPVCKQNNFSWGVLDIGNTHPEVVLGGLTAINVKSLLTIDGEDVFSIKPPSRKHGPFLVNASLFDRGGRQTLKIVDNELQISTSSWDVEVSGGRFKFRSNLREFILVIRIEPHHRLIIERLDMIYKNSSIQCTEGGHTVIKSENGTTLTARGGKISGFDIAINIEGDCMGLGVMSRTHNPGALPCGRLGNSLNLAPRGEGQIKQGRNSMCLCGSGRKFKYCHGQQP